ncbi:MAG: murein biosynthesis integral membrane protein MurJ [Puniceicoccales bacterium]|nr:murein biosynthesis integral membrane protein MurJ [Puniceicoccales bacterium]
MTYTLHPILKMIMGTLCSRILGLLRDTVFFAILGSGMQASAFLIAFAIPNLFRRLCGEGALNSAFIPVFAQRLVHQESSSGHFLNLFFSRVNVYLGVGIVASMGFLYCLQTYAPIHHRWETVINLTCIMLPYLWFICLAALYNGALNVLNAFSLTAFSPILLNVFMLLSLGISTGFENDQTRILIVSCGVVVGGFFQWYLPRNQLKGLKTWQPKFCWQSDKDLQRIWWLFIPSVLGAAIFQINTLLGRLLAFSIDEQAVSLLYLSNRFLELPLGLFAFAIISVLLPQLSLCEAQRKSMEANTILQNSLHLLLMLLLAASVGLFLLAKPILNLFFCWGKFSTQDVQLAVPLLKIFAVGLPFFGLTALLTRVFYANKDTKTPVYIAIYALILYLITALSCIHLYKAAGLALASVLSTIAQCLLLWHILAKRYVHYQLKLIPLIVKKIPCLLLLGTFVYATSRWLPIESPKIETCFLLSTIIIPSALIYGFSLFFMDNRAFKCLQTILRFQTPKMHMISSKD